jgi:PadR family transcriptional regulator PadR
MMLRGIPVSSGAMGAVAPVDFLAMQGDGHRLADVRFPSQAMKGLTPALVLHALGEGPASGVEIIDRVRASSGGHIEIPEGTIYPLLQRLEAQGQVRASWLSASGRRRRVYARTPRGSSACRAHQASWQALFAATRLLWPDTSSASAPRPA